SPSVETTEWIDISVPIYPGMVHGPGTSAIELDTITHVERGDIYTLSELKMSTHTGTHIDGPIHFLAGYPGTDAVPLRNLIGPARVIEIGDPSAVRRTELLQRDIGSSERLLFKTSNSERCWNSSEFVSDAVSFAEDAASYLAELNTLAVGIDYLSAGNP